MYHFNQNVYEYSNLKSSFVI